MYLFAYRNTERGIELRGTARREERRARRMAAQRTAWEAEERAREERRREALALEARQLEIQAELRAMGILPKPSYHRIEERALKVFNITRAELRSHRRHQRLVMVRQFIAYWCVRLTDLSLPAIGRLMGGKDHTTILHHKRKYPERRAKMGRFLRPTR